MGESFFFDKLQKKRKKLALQLRDPAAAGFWDLLVDKYSDQAHFLYELFQNSDDANAQNVRIFLYSDHLEYLHDGTTHFTISDPEREEFEDQKGHLNALTSVGSSTKNKDEKIGKFGVGFKSVFQYTDTPHIEEDQISFDLKDYIVPEKSKEKPSQRKKGETLFYLPFKNPETAYKEIETKLLSLHLPTLFLQKIETITWESLNHKGEYKSSILSKNNQEGISCQFKEFSTSTNNIHSKEYYHLFAKSLDESTLPIQVAYPSTPEGQAFVLDTPQNCYCYFETKCNTGVKYLLQAPFSLTSNREGLKENDDWNILLQKKLACLVGISLEQICKVQKTGDEIIDFLPLNKKTIIPSHPFYSFHKELMTEVKERSIFRTQSGRYVTAKETLYTSHETLKSLLSKEQIEELTLSKSDWCFCTIKENEKIEKLIENQLIAQEVTFSEILQKISPSFLRNQSLEWLKQFYCTANQFTECWQARTSPFKNRPLLLGEDNNFHTLYSDATGTASLYLSSGISKQFTAVHPSLLNDSKCLRFFKNIGITEPGKCAEIGLYILPAYQNGEINRRENEKIASNLNEIIDCYNSLGLFSDERKSLIAQLQKTPIFPALSFDGEKVLKKGDDCCIDTPALRTYLSQNSQINFIDNEFITQYIQAEKRESFYQILSELGMQFGLMIEEILLDPNDATRARLSLSPKSLRQYDKGAQIIKDKEIFGFETFIKHLTPQSSTAFFHLLKEAVEKQSSYLFRLSLQGEYQYIEKGKKHYTQEIISSTTAVQSIFKSRWLYNKTGVACTPDEIGESDELSDLYDVSATDLFFFLGIKLSPTLSNLTPSQREAISIVNKFKNNGISIAMMENILKEIIENKR